MPAVTSRCSQARYPKPWRVGIEDPAEAEPGAPAVVPVVAGGVATSGNARRGRHIVDPGTAQPPAPWGR